MHASNRHSFFGTAADRVDLAVFRAIFFIFFAANFSVPNVVWFSSLPPDLRVAPPWMGWILRHLPINESLAWIASVSLVVCCYAAALGLFTRVSAWMCLVLGWYVLGIPQFYGKINHSHHLLWFAAILAASPCADVLSVDAIRSVWKRADAGVVGRPAPSRAYALPLRFVWLLLGVIYFTGGFWKIRNAGYQWAFSENPKAMLYNKWMELGGWRPLFRIDHYPLLYHLGAAATVVFELSFIVLIVFPATRFLAPLGGLIFHAVTNLFMKLSFWILWGCYAAFVPWDRIFRSIGQRWFREEVYLVFDSDCRVCRRLVACLRTADVLCRITYVDALDTDRLEKDGVMRPDRTAIHGGMHVVAGGEWLTGGRAYRVLAARFPVLWPVMPFMRVRAIQAFEARVLRHTSDTAACRKAIELAESPKPTYLGALVGTALVAAAVLTAAANVQTWPFTAYSMFDSITTAERTLITMSVEDRSGRTREINPVMQQTIAQLPPERLTGLIGPMLSTDDPVEVRKRAAAFWSVWVRETPELKQATGVRFFRQTVSTEPERQLDRPLDRELLCELRF